MSLKLLSCEEFTKALTFFLFVAVMLLMISCSSASTQIQPTYTLTSSPAPSASLTSTQTLTPSATPSNTPTITPTLLPTYTSSSTTTPLPTEIGGGKGNLLFGKYGRKYGSIGSISLDGSDLKSIQGDAGLFSVSPNGDSIAYVNDEGVWLVNLDGSDNRLIVSFQDDFLRNIEWFPDGNTLFLVVSGQRCLTLNIQTKDLIQIPEQGSRCRLSPDGRKIAFDSGKSGRQRIHLMDVDNESSNQITNGPQSNFAPYWSPDGSKIIYCACSPSQDNIGMINADGSNELILVEDAVPFGAVWPNNSSIVFFRNYSSGIAKTISRINLDGTGEIELIMEGRFRSPMSLSPDGQKIAFLGDCLSDLKCDIFVMNIDGTNLQNVTNSPGIYWSIVWQP